MDFPWWLIHEHAERLCGFSAVNRWELNDLFATCHIKRAYNSVGTYTCILTYSQWYMVQWLRQPPWKVWYSSFNEKKRFFPAPWGSVLGLKPPGLEFWILCPESSVITFILPSSGRSLVQFSPCVIKGGLKPH